MNQIFSNFYTNQVQQEIGSLAKRYAQAVVTSPHSTTIEMLEKMSTFSDVKMIMVDTKQQIVGSSNMDWTGDTFPLSVRKQIRFAAGGTEQIILTNPASGERFLGAGEPILAEGRLLGVVYVFSSVSGLDLSIQKVRHLMILSSVGAFLMALGLTFIVSKKLSGPLIQMEQATRKIAQGKLETRVEIPSSDEVGSLAAAINDLAIDLQHYRDSRSEFLANVSHELRTPITYLEGYAKVLRDDVVDNEAEKKQYLDIIYHESIRMSRLIDDLFQLSKMEEGKISLYPEWLEIPELIRTIVQKHELKARAKGLDIETVLPDHMPYAYADGLRLEQIVINLLDNAIRYSQNGQIRAEVRYEPKTPYYTIVVEDTGVGMAEEEVSRIFERFYRVEKSRSRNYGGTGLGLAIVKQLVEILEGTITVKSKVNVGTRFDIRLPIGSEKP
ncbi:sensor histidine kinase [Paenibacillus turpanensis]|uniref:sensor histidine kinase n=1 Tax=Paenibacillus turpanensis TaxID=2689078 RepID=UPI001A9CD220|nr:HAMP domain-containing sensor histidine kinase [Paenibacillus turpanensis]